MPDECNRATPCDTPCARVCDEQLSLFEQDGAGTWKLNDEIVSDDNE